MAHLFSRFRFCFRFRTRKKHPYIIISDEEINQILPVVNILPITSFKDGRTIYPNEVLLPTGIGGLEKDSLILCYQIRTIDKKRLIKSLGCISDPHIQNSIIEALCFQLNISRTVDDK